jgi:uncharacterized protein YceH (UPF0502 family)
MVYRACRRRCPDQVRIPVPLTLTANEVRVIGCLMEKSVFTPEQYPLTLNALTNACNQKSGRNPVMSLQPGVVQRTVRDLEGKHLVRVEENFKSRVEKYTQRFCNTRFSDYQFEPPQFAVVCLLLLRGAQTPGELRARSGRLHAFPDNDAVVDALKSLVDREGGPLVVKLPRTAGRKDSEYMHLFGGAVDLQQHARDSEAQALDRSRDRVSVQELAERVAALESEVASLKDLLESKGA